MSILVPKFEIEGKVRYCINDLLKMLLEVVHCPALLWYIAAS